MRFAAGALAAAVAAVLAPLALASAASARVAKAPVLYLAPENTAGSEPFFARGGLRLTGSCAPGADPVTTITASSAVDDASIHVAAQGQSGLAYAEDDDLDAGDSFTGGLNHADNFIGGQLVYSRPDGRHVTINWGRVYALESGQPKRCAFFGIAQVARPGRDPRARKRVDFRAQPGRSKRVLRAGGLRLRASCTAGGDLKLVATTGPGHAVLHANYQGSGGDGFAGDANLRKGERFPVFGRLGGDDDAAGQIVYLSPAGTVVSVDWMAEEGDAYGGRRACAFAGTARVAGKRSPDRARFARRTSRPFLTPRVAARGVPAPEYTEFMARGPFALLGACAHPQGQPGRLFVRAQNKLAGAGISVEQAQAGHHLNGATGASGSSFDLLSEPTGNAGHTAQMTTTGQLMTASWLAQRQVSLGDPRRRKLCLFAGVTERAKAVG